MNNEDLYQLDKHELIAEILNLRKQLNDLEVSESKSSYVHNYHFTSIELLRLNKDRLMGSAVIITLHTLKGKPLINPTKISDGLSNSTINALLDDLQYTYDLAVELKPTEKRL